MNVYWRAGKASLSRLGIFLFLSIGLHAALLVRLNIGPTIVRDLESPLSVSLTLVETTAPTPKRAASRRALAKARTPTPNTAAAPSPTGETASVARTEIVDADRDANSPEPIDTVPPVERVRERVQALVLADLQGYFEKSYPPIARRQGWEGTVSLAVTIRPDGTLGGVRVVRSSGYDTLDQSAVATMRRVERVVEARPLLNGRPLEVSLPIVYRLTD